MACYTNLLRRTLVTSATRHAIKQVTVIGCGQMGSGIAQVAAQTGHNVTLVDLDEKLLKSSLVGIEKNLTRVAKKKYADNAQDGEEFVKSVTNRIATDTDAIRGCQDSNLVIEAIIEDLETKQKLFAKLDEGVPSEVMFASNTSGFLVKQITKVTRRKDLCGGLHFFYPVQIMKLVEVVSSEETSPATTQALTDFGKAIGKTTVNAKDVPGFITNRLVIPMWLEAAKMVERGDASHEDIDIAMRLGAGHPMGPFQLLDMVGIDNFNTSFEYWNQYFPNNPLFEQCALLQKMVVEGKCGVKSKEGFYNYEKK